MVMAAASVWSCPPCRDGGHCGPQVVPGPVGVRLGDGRPHYRYGIIEPTPSGELRERVAGVVFAACVVKFLGERQRLPSTRDASGRVVGEGGEGVVAGEAGEHLGPDHRVAVDGGEVLGSPSPPSSGRRVDRHQTKGEHGRRTRIRGHIADLDSSNSPRTPK
jgi:hypothetical protein